MIICLVVLIYAFKNVFIPKMDDIYSKREDYISKHIKGAEILEAEILILKKKMDEIKADEIDRTSKIIRKAIKNSNEILNSHVRAIKEENDAGINGVRARLLEEMKSLESSMKESIEKTAKSIVSRLFDEYI
jgi:F0F1-type ATP synthase membrane subunit b/b'